MKPPPAFQLYAQDFLVGTADMAPAEVGAYIRLLCYQWVKSGLPNDPDKLASMAGCHGNATAMPLHKFGICEDGFLRNERLEKIRSEQNEYRAKQAQNAKNGWEKRHGNAKPYAVAMPSHMPEGMPNACSSSSSSSIIHISGAEAQTPITAENKPVRFTAPTPQEVVMYGAEIGFVVDGVKFCDFYASKGWMIGKNRMKDWRACVRTWQRGDNRPAPFRQTEERRIPDNLKGAGPASL
jgi:uncharacterized protein YdaU (DUF1376 family)